MRGHRSVKKSNERNGRTATRKTRFRGTPVFAGWSILLKFGKREHLQAFREKGLLYMNPQRYFAERELAADAVRSDRFEGTDRVFQPWDIRRMTLSQKDRPPIELPGSQFVGPVLLSFGGN